MLRRQTAAAIFALCLLLPASSAVASGADVIIDCNDHGHLTREYSQREYRQALAQMPADIKQYTDCEAIIRRAQLGIKAVIANTANPMEGATPEERVKATAQIEKARSAGKVAQRVGATSVTPGALAFTKVSAATSELPTPLLLLAGLIVLGSVVAAANLIVRARRHEHPDVPGA